jgi:hypothetical protein
VSNETAPPASARSGGATPTGIVPSPAASDPLAGEGSSDAGMDVSSLNCARQVSQPAGRLSGGGQKPAGRSPAQIAERHQKAEAMRAAMLERDLTVAEAAREVGISERRGHKIAVAYGLRASPQAVARRKAAFSAESARLGLQRSLEARREYFARTSAAARARDHEIIAYRQTHPDASQAAVVAALGVSAASVARVLHGWRKPQPVRATTTPKAPPAPKVNKTHQRQIERAEIAEQMRALVERGLPIRTAGRQLGLSKTKADTIARAAAIKHDPMALKNWRAARAAERNAVQAAERRKAKPAKPPAAAPLAPPNPKRTRAQQRQANLIKSREWRRRDTRLQALPAPSRDEADALVAQFLARRSVTVCPPAAEVQEPHNSGVGWR